MALKTILFRAILLFAIFLGLIYVTNASDHLPPGDLPAGNRLAPSHERRTPQSSNRTPPPGENIFLWDGFESQTPQAGWSTDSAADPAELKILRSQHTQGDRSLRIRPRFGDKDRVLVRRAGKVNFKGLDAVFIDAFASQSGLQLAFAYKDPAGGWHESEPVALKEGWNKNIRCSVAELTAGHSESVSRETGLTARQFYITLLDNGLNQPPTVVVDNLRFRGTATGDWNTQAPAALDVFQPTRSVGRYGQFELGVQFEGTYGNLFDTDDTRVRATFTDPDGVTQTVNGFMAGYADHDRFGKNWPIFLIRFAPTKIGRWTFRVDVTNPRGTTRGKKRWFYVSDSQNRGFIRVDSNASQYFAFENGDFYYPIGQNVAWSQNYESYMQRMVETGQNWIRIWMCPWHLQLEKKLGHYHLKNARRLDHIVEEARKRNIYIQLVFAYHGMLTGDSWGKNPYNWQNEGPCYRASDFFTNQQARKLFKQRLDYIVARWGYATNIFAWELFNEVDLTRYNRFGDVTQWHREMSSYLNNIDPNNHLVTTSLSEKNEYPRLWDLPNIDFMPLHLYGKDIAAVLLERYRELRSFPKPWFVAEYARSTDMAEVKNDTHGRSLRNALWASAVLPTAGSVMHWWWDSYIQPHRLNQLYKPVSEFTSGIDRRQGHYRIVDSTLLQQTGTEIGIRGMVNNTSCYLWIHPHNDDKKGDTKDSSPLIQKEQKIVVRGMLAGKYDVMVMEISTGETIYNTRITPRQGQLNIPLPDCDGQVAIRVRYEGNPEPEVHLEEAGQ